jgi:hypothetical protein
MYLLADDPPRHSEMPIAICHVVRINPVVFILQAIMAKPAKGSHLPMSGGLVRLSLWRNPRAKFAKLSTFTCLKRSAASDGVSSLKNGERNPNAVRMGGWT